MLNSCELQVQRWPRDYSNLFLIYRELNNAYKRNKLIIYPIYKKGEKFEFSNNRLITLLNTAYKIPATVISNRLTASADDLLSQGQNGFRRNRSTTDSIFITQQILVKCYEYDIEKRVLCIGFEQALGSVDRQKIIQIFYRTEISNMLIRLTKMTT
jgi:hypothetical protein